MNTSRIKNYFEGTFLNIRGVKLAMDFLIRNSDMGGGASAEKYATYPSSVLRNEDAGGISACLCSAVAFVAGCLCSQWVHIHTECGLRTPIARFGYNHAHKYTH